MASKKPATNQELDDLFAQVEGGENHPSGSNQKSEKNAAQSTADADEDVFADLKSQLNVPSRSSTPRVSSSTTSIHKNTPTSSNSGRSSEEKATASLGLEADQKTQRTPSAPISASQQGTDIAASENSNKGSGWWGGLSGLSSFASSAVKQAQGAVEQLQKNEEAQKWVEQAKGNVGLLKGLGMSGTTQILGLGNDVLILPQEMI